MITSAKKHIPLYSTTALVLLLVAAAVVGLALPKGRCAGVDSQLLAWPVLLAFGAELYITYAVTLALQTHKDNCKEGTPRQHAIALAAATLAASLLDAVAHKYVEDIGKEWPTSLSRPLGVAVAALIHVAWVELGPARKSS